jgi:hypothetical protein
MKFICKCCAFVFYSMTDSPRLVTEARVHQMSDEQVSGVDPRFDPVFQRGFDHANPTSDRTADRTADRTTDRTSDGPVNRATDLAAEAPVAPPTRVSALAPAPPLTPAVSASAPVEPTLTGGPTATPLASLAVPAVPAGVAEPELIVVPGSMVAELHEPSAETFSEVSAARNPFLIALALIALALIIAGVWLFVQSGDAFNSKQVQSTGAYMSLNATINTAPLVALLGAATAIGVLFVFAARYRRRRNGS